MVLARLYTLILFFQEADMRRYLARLPAILIAVFALAGCGGGGGDEETQSKLGTPISTLSLPFAVQQ